jgi:hypothetical protein
VILRKFQKLKITKFGSILLAKRSSEKLLLKRSKPKDHRNIRKDQPKYQFKKRSRSSQVWLGFSLQESWMIRGEIRRATEEASGFKGSRSGSGVSKILGRKYQKRSRKDQDPSKAGKNLFIIKLLFFWVLGFIIPVNFANFFYLEYPNY